MQVWFQNRRAKFRRNERNILAQRTQQHPQPPSTNCSSSYMASGSVSSPMTSCPTPPSLTSHYPSSPTASHYLVPSFSYNNRTLTSNNCSSNPTSIHSRQSDVDYDNRQDCTTALFNSTASCLQQQLTPSGF